MLEPPPANSLLGQSLLALQKFPRYVPEGNGKPYVSNINTPLATPPRLPSPSFPEQKGDGSTGSESSSIDTPNFNTLQAPSPQLQPSDRRIKPDVSQSPTLEPIRESDISFDSADLSKASNQFLSKKMPPPLNISTVHMGPFPLHHPHQNSDTSSYVAPVPRNTRRNSIGIACGLLNGTTDLPLDMVPLEVSRSGSLLLRTHGSNIAQTLEQRLSMAAITPENLKIAKENHRHSLNDSTDASAETSLDDIPKTETDNNDELLLDEDDEIFYVGGKKPARSSTAKGAWLDQRATVKIKARKQNRSQEFDSSDQKEATRGEGTSNEPTTDHEDAISNPDHGSSSNLNSSNEKLASSNEQLNELIGPHEQLMKMGSFTKRSSTTKRRKNQSPDVLRNPSRPRSAPHRRQTSREPATSMGSPPLKGSEEVSTEGIDEQEAELGGSLKKENIFLKIFQGDPEQIFGIKSPRTSGHFPNNFNIMNQPQSTQARDSAGNIIRVVQYPAGSHHKRNADNILAKLFTLHSHHMSQHNMAKSQSFAQGGGLSDSGESSKRGSSESINQEDLASAETSPTDNIIMAGTLAHPIAISTSPNDITSPISATDSPEDQQASSPETAQPSDPTPPADTDGQDFESLAAIGATKNQDKPHNPFNFFKPLHLEGSGGSGGGEKGHDIFKDLLTSRHRRAASNQPSPTTGDLPTGGKAMQRSFSDAGMSEKYKRHDEILGKGANAVVRLAHKQDAFEGEATLYAVKEFRKRRRGEHPRDYVKKVIAEFCISSSMHHENVIETIDLIQDENEKWCEVMEYMPGGDLFSRISQQTLTDFEEINCYFKQLLAGVTYIHSMGVAHRDLKPENLLLDSEHRILKIADFGVSEVFKTCFEKSSRKAKGVCGSEPYIAPEEWEEEAEYDGTKVDIWACGNKNPHTHPSNPNPGIIYYTMLCNSVPWRVAKSSDHHFSDYLSKRRPDVSSGFFAFDRLHPGPRGLFYKILDPNADKRPGAAELLANEWLSTMEVCKHAAGEQQNACSTPTEEQHVVWEKKPPLVAVRHTHNVPSPKH
ncbi:serine/threonine-protein kinase HAL4/sat4 [Phlyctochytrium planicorne]|nr:serine/threonine-protein kinase HAL4/sat4 [Phlyctochytrium planicorne]